MKSARSSSRPLTLTGSLSSLTSWSLRDSVPPGTTSPQYGRCTDGRARSTTGRRDESHSARGVVSCHRSSSAPSVTIRMRSLASSLCRSLMVDLTTSAGFSKRPKPLMADLMRRRPARYGGRQDTALAVVLDCADLDRAAEFWCGVLGYVALPKEPGSGPYRVLLPADGDGIELLLQQVPDSKATKNRMHLDLRVLDLEAEVSRLVALGARYATGEPLKSNGWVWYVFLDPDGNEFCVLRPPGENRDRLTQSHGGQ
jgi:predicted enzyme related to lactoylglutathione lyase